MEPKPDNTISNLVLAGIGIFCALTIITVNFHFQIAVLVALSVCIFLLIFIILLIINFANVLGERFKDIEKSLEPKDEK